MGRVTDRNKISLRLFAMTLVKNWRMEFHKLYLNSITKPIKAFIFNTQSYQCHLNNIYRLYQTPINLEWHCQATYLPSVLYLPMYGVWRLPTHTWPTCCANQTLLILRRPQKSKARHKWIKFYERPVKEVFSYVLFNLLWN